MPGQNKNPARGIIEKLSKIPGIGNKSAQRIAFFLLKQSPAFVQDLIQTLRDFREKTIFCSTCNNITLEDPCVICTDPARDQSTVCILEEPYNVISLEKTRHYRGVYHVIHGNLSPLRGVGPDELKLHNLKPRIDSGRIREIIIATSPTTEGNATAHYIYEIFKNYPLKITRIALGLPIGSDIDYVDSLTISRALQDRSEFT
jgi:recombination protein RecR